ncbi:cadmium-translocating P-type ATPase [Sansalvadorimonas sp. 2012CJ34-2]|uniref:Cadmium-translocating P-type ATPase n=1 Tax=Parendozoicomonas callyspongiae TaxID=2942213 RepID=A0ABT0PHZ7_9GAMM|nr:heavy metal translocating P-type ATPase [Sansalvadorimonas sp. 2012CJ34-2]MCL6271010.1 cadmium-translocating P-type ATPase [Sansalvadorimonas sp. 2012CJ34-2]
MSERCYHCHLPITGEPKFFAEIEGVQQPMCCPGCQAVATAIAASGLDNYYQYRTQPAQQAEDNLQLTAEGSVLLAEYQLYDRDDLQSSFTRTLSDNNRETKLLIEGITCSACVWLLEHHLSQLEGVESVSVNLTQHTATLTWNPEETKISELMAAVLFVGYKAHPWRQEKQTALLEQENRRFIRQLAVAGIGAMQVMMYAIALYAGGMQDMEVEYRDFIRWISALIATPVVFYAARPFFSAAWRDLKNLHPGMDVPVSLAIGGAYVASIWGTIVGSADVYFDSVSMFTFFLLTGRYLEMRARHKTSHSSRSLHQLLPESCFKVKDDGSCERVPPADLQPGDKIRVLPGDSIPADGSIIHGTSSINESALTGEHLPVVRRPGDTVTAGTINTENALDIRVTQVGQSTRLSAIARLLEQAQSDKPAIARMADRIASYFVSAVLIFAVAIYVFWYQTKPDDAFWIVLSVLVATCPCALSLATPTALTVVTGYLQSKGFLISHGHVLEGLPQVTHVIFDKTGTLTRGELNIREMKIINAEMDKQALLDIAAALESHSEHPIAKAFPSSTLEVKDVRNITAQGLEGKIGDNIWRIGKPSFASPNTTATLPDIDTTWLMLSCNQQPQAWFGMDDTIRPEAAGVISKLQKRGLKVDLLSGDNLGVVNRVAGELNIDSSRGMASPDDKLDYVRQLQETGARVLMVGDGINDIPVLAGADISVAMNTASDLACTHADALLMAGDLNRLLDAFDKAVQTNRIIHENTVWAICYNLLALPLAAMGLLAPWMAAIGMSASSLVVVGNALRLSNTKRENGKRVITSTTEVEKPTNSIGTDGAVEKGTG